MSSLSRSDRSPRNDKTGWGLELLLAAALAVRCVPSFALKQDDQGQGGDPGLGGEAGAAVSGSGGSGGTSGAVGGNSGATMGGTAGATSGAGGEGDAGAGGPGGEAGDGGSGDAGGSGASSGSGGSAASGGNGGGGAGAAGRGGGGVAGASGAGKGGASGSGGSAGSGGSGAVRACGSGGAPYAWANWCLPNHPGQGPYPQSYDTSTPGIVRDRVTGLVWQHPVNGVFAQRTFAQTPSHCADLAAAVYGGYGDWRVPSVIELASIVDYAVSGPAIDTAAFPGTPNANFWTSAPGVSSEAWIVAFEYGVVTTENPSLVRNVRCVR